MVLNPGKSVPIDNIQGSKESALDQRLTPKLKG
jgi:hypothetical protein